MANGSSPLHPWARCRAQEAGPAPIGGTSSHSKHTSCQSISADTAMGPIDTPGSTLWIDAFFNLPGFRC